MPAGLLGLGAGRDGRFSRGGIKLGSPGIWILIDGAGKGIEDWQQAGCLHPSKRRARSTVRCTTHIGSGRWHGPQPCLSNPNRRAE